MRKLSKIIMLFGFMISSFLIGTSSTYAREVINDGVGSCYCCGSSATQCTYSWRERGETIPNNCYKATNKTESACNGVNGSTTSATGACFRCCMNRDCGYKWTSGESPAANCGLISSIKTSSDCTGTYSEKVAEIKQSEGVEGPDANLTVGDATCDGILGSGKFKEYLVEFLNIIRIVGVALVIIFSSLDFGKALIAQDNEALKKSSQTAFKRLTIAIIIFFLPIVLNILLSLVGLSGICI